LLGSLRWLSIWDNPLTEKGKAMLRDRFGANAHGAD
jgi:hypothetical protein